MSRPAGVLPRHPVAIPENVRAAQHAPPSSGLGPREPAALAYGGGWGGGRPHVHLAVTHWLCGAITLSWPSLGRTRRLHVRLDSEHLLAARRLTCQAWTACLTLQAAGPPDQTRVPGLAHCWEPSRSTHNMRALLFKVQPAVPSPCGHVTLGESPVHGCLPLKVGSCSVRLRAWENPTQAVNVTAGTRLLREAGLGSPCPARCGTSPALCAAALLSGVPSAVAEDHA